MTDIFDGPPHMADTKEFWEFCEALERARLAGYERARRRRVWRGAVIARISRIARAFGIRPQVRRADPARECGS